MLGRSFLRHLEVVGLAGVEPQHQKQARRKAVPMGRAVLGVGLAGRAGDGIDLDKRTVGRSLGRVGPRQSAGSSAAFRSRNPPGAALIDEEFDARPAEPPIESRQLGQEICDLARRGRSRLEDHPQPRPFAQPPLSSLGEHPRRPADSAAAAAG